MEKYNYYLFTLQIDKVGINLKIYELDGSPAVQKFFRKLASDHFQ